MKKTTSGIVLHVALLTLMSSVSLSQSANAQEASSKSGQGERLNVDSIRQKYWAKGEDSQMSVVQNRLYTKAGRVGVSLFTGSFSDDPFLSTRAMGGSVGYFFNETFGLHLTYWKLTVSNSSAADEFLRSASRQAIVNPPSSFTGAELSSSLLYGKLSLLGKAIIYYDMHLSGGVGLLNTQTGNYLAPNFGIGQLIYLNKTVGLRADYHLMYHSETLPEIGTQRSVWTNVVTVGLQFLFL